MAIYTYRDVTPTLVENTTMQVKIKDGVDYQYTIRPNNGYVLHDGEYDYTLPDDITGEEIPFLGYRTSTATCAVSYDFSVNPREFYAVLRSEVPEDQIFGIVTEPDHEIM